MNVNVRVEHPVCFYVVRGKANFASWQKSPADHTIYFKHASIRSQKFDFDIEHADDYYFVLESEKGLPSTGSVVFTIDATVIDELYAKERFRLEETNNGGIRVHEATRTEGHQQRILSRLPVGVLWNAHSTRNTRVSLAPIDSLF